MQIRKKKINKKFRPVFTEATTPKWRKYFYYRDKLKYSVLLFGKKAYFKKTRNGLQITFKP